MISFARGAPAPECLDAVLLADCARTAIERDPGVLAYGPGGGYGPLREWLAERHGVEPARVLVTNGGLQGFVFYAEELLAERPGRVLVEAPTYDRPLKILARLGADVVALPMDEEGLDPDAFARELDAGPTSFLYTIPTFQNPSGRTLSEERRRRLVELAAAHGVPVLEDDPYGLVRYEGESPPTLHELEGGDVVTYASSFSKTVAPGVRVGWFVAPAALAARMEARAVSTYISPPFLTQATVHEAIARGAFEPNLDRIRGLLRARRDAMLAALDSELAGDATWSRPQGGYFLWVDLGLDAGELLERAEEAGRDVREGRGLLPGWKRRRALGAARVQLRVAVGDRLGRLDSRVAHPRLTAPVELREQHAADQAGEEREQDQPDHGGRRLAEDEVDPRLVAVAGDERDQVGDDQDQDAERDPQARLPGAVELVLGRVVVSLRHRPRVYSDARRASRRRATRPAASAAVRAWAAAAAGAHPPSPAGTWGTERRRGGRRVPPDGSSNRCSLPHYVCP